MPFDDIETVIFYREESCGRGREQAVSGLTAGQAAAGDKIRGGCMKF